MQKRFHLVTRHLGKKGKNIFFRQKFVLRGISPTKFLEHVFDELMQKFKISVTSNTNPTAILRRV